MADLPLSLTALRERITGGRLQLMASSGKKASRYVLFMSTRESVWIVFFFLKMMLRHMCKGIRKGLGLFSNKKSDPNSIAETRKCRTFDSRDINIDNEKYETL